MLSLRGISVWRREPREVSRFIFRVVINKVQLARHRAGMDMENALEPGPIPGDDVRERGGLDESKRTCERS